MKRQRLAGIVSVVAMVAAACGGATTTSTITSPTATPTTASASQAPIDMAAGIRCAETDDATPSVTVSWTEPVVAAEPSIRAGQAVKFVTTGFSPTVTEWTNGTPAVHPCIDRTIGSDATAMSVVVTFYELGDYDITCRKTPEDMHTVVHVH